MRYLILASLLVGCGGKETNKPADADTSSDDTDTDTDEPQPHWALEADFLNIGHRGAADLAPENTLEAIEAGLDAGADAIEIDLHMTKDGHVVLLHDSTVDKTTEGTGLIKEMTLAEAQTLDAGYDFTIDGTTTPFRGTGVVIPTWVDALEMFPEAYWDVEIKQTDPPIYDQVIADIEAAGAKDRVFIACFDDDAVKDIRKDHPTYVTNFGRDEGIVFAGLSGADEDDYVPPGEIVQVQSFYVNDDFMARIAKFDLKLHIWTVNDATEMQRLIDLGVDGIITDAPDVLSGL